MAWLRDKTQPEENRADLNGTDRLINLNRIAMFYMSPGGTERKPGVFVIPYDGARPERIPFKAKEDAELFMDGLSLILESNPKKVYSKKEIIEIGRALTTV